MPNLALKPTAKPVKDYYAALAAYSFNPNWHLLTQLRALNRQIADRIDRNADVIAPGLPKSYGNPKTLETRDGIAPN